MTFPKLVNFYGPNREYFFVNKPEGFSVKCFECVNCNENCTEGKIIQHKIICMKCAYPSPFWCNK